MADPVSDLADEGAELSTITVTFGFSLASRLPNGSRRLKVIKACPKLKSLSHEGRLCEVRGVLTAFERRANAARQVIVEGNATDKIGSDKLQLISEGTIPETIADLRIEPPILTPNGDGRNDYAQISFTLFGVLDARIDITFYNLSGEPVRQLKALHQKAGLNAALAWDGRDASGELVSPGLYLCAVKTATSRGDFVVSRPIALAY